MLQMQVANSENIRFIRGVTDGTADTALATLCPNPFLNNPNVFVEIFGEGVYVEDDGSDTAKQSGITATTIDVRSTLTSKRFVGKVTALGPGGGHLVDHSAVTT
jgi:hypothetical protein